MNVIGIDASPTASGIALPDGTTQTWKIPDLKKDGHHTGPRLENIFRRFRDVLTDWEADIIVMEGYNVGMKQFGHVFQIGEVGGVFKLAVNMFQIPLLVVSPSARSQFGCGKGGQPKKVVKESWEKLTGLKFADDNQTDAHILREIGRYCIGAQDVVRLPSPNLMALTELKQSQRHIIEQGKQRLTRTSPFE